MKKSNYILLWSIAIFLFAVAYLLLGKAVGLGPILKEYVVGWGTLALINAGLAQSKHKSGFYWFLLSLLLGPIATFLLVLTGEFDSK
ncbi:hypothetical protein TR13x_08890 [Caloranaerobacter sp. TR13]|uniref:hypothetical protein n=1 Tax=Caloranaerobacter sp. TR13 TaxID=1302151 RepID=UPI0006D45216|nr:hypothetical protein [Caloranaerobacter sp. TR13]KPU26684.1 hypothetical protein TR13x_08890 [Caloranaerobacter sp. TR13]